MALFAQAIFWASAARVCGRVWVSGFVFRMSYSEVLPVLSTCVWKTT